MTQDVGPVCGNRISVYPLKWPEGWPRTPSHMRQSKNRFLSGTTYEYDSSAPKGRRYVGRKPVRFDVARKKLTAELERMGATNVVISTNIPLRQDGLPRADIARHTSDDPGIAVYFTHKKRQLVMAQDAYSGMAGNMRSLGLAIEALRQLERHGGGTMMERAFAGFIAIAPPSWKKPWREVFGVRRDWRGDIKAMYRDLAKHRHSDTGGGHDTIMAELNVAYAEAKQELGIA